MGYLHIPASSLPNFTKAVISLWFRIPAATFTTVDAISDTAPVGFQNDHMCSMCYFPVLTKIIPLLTFGSLETDSAANACQPSFVGIDCFGGLNVLAVNLQTPVFATLPASSTPSVPRPECFYMSGRSSPPTNNTTISAATWHHALISFDISGSSSVTYNTGPGLSYASTHSFNWALDDTSRVNISMRPSGGGQYATQGLTDLTAIVSQGLVDYEGVVNGDVTSVSGCHIASNGNPIGAPSSSGFVSNIYKIELAELQIFTGVTLDSSVEANRRAFITSTGDPANMALAEALLGQTPDIKLHGSNNWKLGLNTGSLGTTFTPVGTITPYTPNPGD